MAIPDRNIVKSGRTEARLPLLAMRRVQLKIDRELKHADYELASLELTS